ncbi:MAG: hypothetical protein R2932_09715 [Caldilineaceae bacterium]
MSSTDESPFAWREALRLREISAYQTNDVVEGKSQAGWKYQVDLGNEYQALERLLSVIEIVISQPRHQWPSDEEWRTKFPSWFNEKTPSYSREEAESILALRAKEGWYEIPWDFGSWLDAIREREWMWYAYEEHLPYVTIYLGLSGWPANLGTIEHVFKCAGAQIMTNEKM